MSCFWAKIEIFGLLVNVSLVSAIGLKILFHDRKYFVQSINLLFS